MHDYQAESDYDIGNRKPKFFGLQEDASRSKAILPAPLIVVAVSWDVERRVKEAILGHSLPSACLSILLELPSEEMQWAHSSLFIFTAPSHCVSDISR